MFLLRNKKKMSNYHCYLFSSGALCFATSDIGHVLLMRELVGADISSTVLFVSVQF